VCWWNRWNHSQRISSYGNVLTGLTVPVDRWWVPQWDLRLVPEWDFWSEPTSEIGRGPRWRLGGLGALAPAKSQARAPTKFPTREPSGSHWGKHHFSQQEKTHPPGCCLTTKEAEKQTTAGLTETSPASKSVGSHRNTVVPHNFRSLLHSSLRGGGDLWLDANDANSEKRPWAENRSNQKLRDHQIH
jgi:hypothetical protein